jgi:bifunctional UDP-N-acetylglucosamine pyrophosphorylase/glucosamine-1-phosphate N-acetyltransferase
MQESRAPGALTVVVLAAGQGMRMKSRVPKVLHPVAGRPLLYYPLKAALDAGADGAVIVTSGLPEIALQLAQHLPAAKLSFVTQEAPRGTGDAARIGLAKVQSERVLIICGDTPLVSAEELSRLVAALGQRALVLLSCELGEPAGYGRVLRDARGRVVEVREHRDLKTDAERTTREVNAGMYAARSDALREVLARISPNNAQGEYYLTDVVRLLGPEHVDAVLGHADALIGVNDRRQLREAEERMFARIRARHALAGVTTRGDVLIDDSVELESDVVLEAGVRLRGRTRIATGAFIDVGCVLDDAIVSEGAHLKPYSVLASSEVGAKTEIGPFSHLRPDSVIEEGARIGNFVETKKTRVRKGAKASHLSYLGDADVGEGANIGAGTIVCNYDGFSKHKTVIGAGAFVGSDSQLVAPVTIGEGAYVATGTTVTTDVPSEGLAIGRVRQENKAGYATTLKARLKAARGQK